jgi:hypothetical protein
MHHVAIREHDFHPEDVMNGEAVLEAVRAAGIFGDIPADGTHLLTRRIGRVVEAVRRDLSCNLQIRDARLNGDTAIRDVHIEHPIEPREPDKDTTGNRHGAAGQPAAVATRDKRNVVPIAQPHDFLNLLRR